MKLLNVEVTSRGEAFYSRYDTFRKMGSDIYYLTSSSNIEYPYFKAVVKTSSQSISALIEAAVNWHRQEHFEAIITTDEASVIATAIIAKALKLPNISISAAKRSRNKYLMRMAHQNKNAPHPPFHIVRNLNEALRYADTIGYPVVVKPTLGGNAEHVHLIRNEERMSQVFPVLYVAKAKYSYSSHEASGVDSGPDEFIIEGYLSGSEHCIEAWVYNGEVHIGSIADRLSKDLDLFDNDLYRTPTELCEDDIEKLRSALNLGIKAQGIEQGAVHAEFRFHEGEAYILEIAARVGGGSLARMAMLSYNYCPITTANRIAMNQNILPYNYKSTGVVAVGLTMLCKDSGVILDIEIPQEVYSHPNVFNLAILAQQGDYHRRPPEGNDMFGYIGVSAKSQDKAIQLAAYLFSQIKIKFG